MDFKLTATCRVVVYKDGADKVGQSAVSGQTALIRELWKALAVMGETGGEVMAIAHNGNLSNGMMFPTRRSTVTRSTVCRMSRWSRFTRSHR